MSALTLLAQPADAEVEVDVYELADEAAEALEAYQRAPWNRLNDRLRLEKLRKAIELLQRVERFETLQTPTGNWVA